MATLYESPLKRSHFELELEDIDPSPKRVYGAYSEPEEIIYPSNSWAQAFANSSFERIIPRDGKKRSGYFEDYSRAKRVLIDSLVDQENENNPYVFTPNMKRLPQSFGEEVQSIFDPHKRQRPESYQPTQETADPWTTYKPTPPAPPNSPNYPNHHVNSPNQYAIVPVQKPFRNFKISEEYYAPYPPRPLHAELPQEYLQLTVWEPPSLGNGRLFEIKPTLEPTDQMDLT